MKRKAQGQGHLLALLCALSCVGYTLAGACYALENAGEQTWRMPGLYANLTIDDPWLIEPYGHLEYEKLLNEMEKANFHTTIAFIPWNYDRSEDDVAALFREHPDRFSVCIHGNNHDHREFYRYEADLRDSLPAKPLAVQEENIVQALARMERFQELTGVDYDRVMVFPHAIAPAKTLGLLKKHGFLSTVNAGNVPLGTELPVVQVSRPHFEPLLFENFVSLNRWPAGHVSRDDIVDAISQGRPLLFYEHHGFFEKGRDSFNPIAEMVNTIEPRIRWKSLGYISRHLYLLRLRSDGDYDVRAFCKRLEFENRLEQSVVYHIAKEENFVPPVKSIMVDGESITFEKTDDTISFSVEVPAGVSCIVDIEYETTTDFSTVDVSKKGIRVAALRRLSDFRDLHMVNSIAGRGITRIYYGSGANKLGPMRSALIGLSGLAFVLLSIAFIWRHVRNKRAKHSLAGEKES